MSIYQEAIAYFKNISGVDIWQEMPIIFERIANASPEHWLLPVNACEAVGGRSSNAVPSVVAIGCSHISIILVDDMLDVDPRGEYKRIGEAATANLACAFQAASLDAILNGGGTPIQLSSTLGSFNRMYLMTALGQYLDVQLPANESEYWRMVQTKSSPFFEAALRIGAIAGGASLNVIDKLGKIGYLYGKMIQIHDDLSDTMAFPASPDWQEGRVPLPILFAQTVEYPERDVFLELRNKAATDTDALYKAQEILIRCGAVSYCVSQLLEMHQKAQEILLSTDLVYPGAIEKILSAVVEPVENLFENVSKIYP